MDDYIVSMAGRILRGRGYDPDRYEHLTMARGQFAPRFAGQMLLFDLALGFVNFCASILVQHRDNPGMFDNIRVPQGTPEQLAAYVGQDHVRHALIDAGFRQQ